MKMKRKLSAFMVVVLIVTMICRYDLVVRAEGADINIGTDATPSDGKEAEVNLTSGSIRVDSIAELTDVLSALAIQPVSGNVSETSYFPADYVPSEEELDAWNQGTATGSNALHGTLWGDTATDSDATVSDAVMVPFSTIITIVLTQQFMDDFNSGSATIPLSALPADRTVILKNFASGEYISKGYEHFTMASANSGTYIFQDMVLYGGVNPSSKGKGGIKATGGYVGLQNVSFHNFNSRAVYDTGELNVSDCVFSDFEDSYVIADNNVTIDNSLLINCNSFNYYHGSAVKIGNKLEVSNSTIINCGGGTTIVGGYTAGAIGGIGMGTLTVNNCYFTENHGNKYGGAISLYQFGGTVTIKDSYFLNNDCLSATINTDGGAVGLFNNGQTAVITVDGCTFEGNISGDDAGALFAESNSTTKDLVVLLVKNSTFAENEAYRYDSLGDGGAVQLSLNVKAEFINNTFTGNVCKNPSSGELGSGAAVGGYSALQSNPLAYKTPTVSFKNNLFVGNTGQPSSASNNRYTNIGREMTATDAGGNIGYDFSAASHADLTVQSVYGVSSVSTAENGSSMEAGCNLTTSAGSTYDRVIIPTYWIAPAITNDAGNIVNPAIHADNVVASNEYVYDQRGMARVDDDDSDAGAVEIISAKFDANLGSWAAGGTYTYDDPLLYVKKLAADTGYTYVYSAADPGTSSVEVPVNPARAAFGFKGWTLTKDGTDFVTNAAGFTPGRTYYAKWGQDVRLDLTYHLNDGSGTTKVDPDGDYLENTGVSVKSIAGLLWTAPADSYFKGWTAVSSPLPADTRYQPGDTFTITSTSQNLYAEWQEHYQLSYGEGANPAEVSGMPLQPANKIDKGQSIHLALEIPVRADWRFEGWKSDISGDSAVYQPGQAFTMPGQNVVMTAVWTQNKNLDLTYHLNDGSGVTKIDSDGGYAPNTGVEVKSLGDLSWSVPAKYRFKGWTTVANPSAADVRYQKGDVFTLGDRSGHLYAEWLRLCTVTFESKGGTVIEPVRDVESGSTIARPSVTRLGYTFTGWFTDDGTFRNEWNFDSDLVTEDMTLYASWSRNSGGGGGGGGGGGENPQPTVPQPTDPTVTEPTIVPSTTSPDILPPGYYVEEKDGELFVFDSEGIPQGYLIDNVFYPYNTLPKTGDDQKAGKNNLLYAMLISAGGFLTAGGVLMKRKREEDQF